MKTLVCLLTLIGLTWATGVGSAQKKLTPLMTELMQKKLKASQGVLEGLALGEFSKITRGAEEIVQISKTTEWQFVRTPRFELHTLEFRTAAENLLQKGKERNLDGAALAYVELTLSCVRCHRYVRDVRDARLGNNLGHFAFLQEKERP